jgi:hypothetical protein
MNEQHDSFDRRSEPEGKGQADRNYREERLHRALTVLRRFSDWQHNPQPLQATISRVRREAEMYQRWMESGAIIRDVIIRLADGREITVEKDKTINTDMFTFGFSWQFPPREVLHVFKRADDEFGEVLLLTVELSRVPATGYSYSRTFDNGQSFALEVRPSPNGAFDVSVNYSMHPSRASAASSGGRFAWIPIFAPALGFLASLGALFGTRARRRYGFVTRLAYSLALVGATTAIIYGVSYFSGKKGLESDAAHRTASGASNASTTKTAMPPETAEDRARLVQTAGLMPDGATPQQTHPPLATDSTSVSGAEFSATKHQAPAAEQGLGRGADNVTHSTPPKDAASCQVPNRGTSTPPPPATTAKLTQQQHQQQRMPIPLYVKVSMGDEQLTMDMQEAFVSELMKTNRFHVMTDKDKNIPSDVYEVSLWFLPEEGCAGKIFYKVYDTSGPAIGEGEHYCHQFPKGELLVRASRLMASEVMTKIKDAQAVASKSGGAE